jgi:hypothetical protein
LGEFGGPPQWQCCLEGGQQMSKYEINANLNELSASGGLRRADYVSSHADQSGHHLILADRLVATEPCPRTVSFRQTCMT